MIEAYLEDHKLAWQPSTLRSEGHRLNAVATALTGKPEDLWELLEEKELSPYSRLTTFTRVTAYWQWLIDEGHKSGPNPYAKWRKKHARLFKHAYQRKIPSHSFEEARKAIAGIRCPETRAHALELLRSGLRYHESLSREGDTVTGKGGRTRTVYGAPSSLSRVSYQRLRRALKKVGLKPHDLRKIYLNELVKKGAGPYELKEIAGWSSISTSDSYIKFNNPRIKELANVGK